MRGSETDAVTTCVLDEAGVHRQDLAEAGEKQARAHEKDEGEGHLGHHEGAAQGPGPAAPAGGAPFLAQDGGQVGRDHGGHGEEAHQEADRQRQGEGVRGGGGVEADVGGIGKVLQVEEIETPQGEGCRAAIPRRLRPP